MRDRTSIMFAAVLACVGALVAAAAIYALPAVPSLDDDVCNTHGPPREGTSSSQRRSWWPIGVECRYRVPGRAEPIVRFEGPPAELRWVAVGLAGFGIAIAVGGVLIGIRDLARPDPVRRW